MAARPEFTTYEKKQATEAVFKHYWDRLNKVEQSVLEDQIRSQSAEIAAGRRRKVEKVFKVYRAILQEIQDAAIADRPEIDLQGLWEEHKFMEYHDRAWMDNCSRCVEDPPLGTVGPFGESVMGVNVASVFGIVTGTVPPKPSRFDRIFREALEVALVFGPDIAMGMEMAWLRNAGLRHGLMYGPRLERLTVDQYLSAVPGSSIALSTYGLPYEAGMQYEAMQLGYRTLGASEGAAARLGMVTPVPDSVRALGKEAIVKHEIEMFLKPADRIVFWLTGEEHLHEDSITFMELKRIWDDPALYNKTEWLANPAAVEWVDEIVPEMPGVVDLPGREDLPVIKLRLPD